MRKVVIVGGGSAGWMTAAYLHGALNDRGEKKTVDITLIESPDVPRISIGEATIPSIRHVLEVIGVDELKFMQATEATFKQSIKYVNWLENKGEAYHHPFTRLRRGPIDMSGRDWIKSQRNIPFMETVSPQPIISDLNIAPFPMGEHTFDVPLKYAYHLDAQKFADFLKYISVQRGLNHIEANMTSAKVKPNGYIEHVLLDDGRKIAGDLFIDCTGFRGLLIEKALDSPFDDFSQWLLCDQAIVAQFPYEDYYPGAMRPYTTATALSSGWVWDVPIQSRRSVGYVHSSKFITPKAAKAELLAYQDLAINDYETRTIDFKVGQRRNAWVGNCIAIGLSGGFIEPLESTGLYMCDLAAVMLAEHFPYRDQDMDALSVRFNRIISNRYYEILDFINMHYALTQRTDSAFWREVQNPERMSERLKAKLEYWRIKPPTQTDFEGQVFGGVHDKILCPDTMPPVDTAGLWNHESYESILYGMNFRVGEFGDNLPPSKVPQDIIDALRQAPRKLAPHHIWLFQNLGMPPWDTQKKPVGWI